jgi:hypothetical protein
MPSRRKSGPSSIIALGESGIASRGHGGFMFDGLFLPPSRPYSALISVGFKSGLIAERFKRLKPQEKDDFQYEI